MQTTVRKSSEKPKPKEKSKEELLSSKRVKDEEKLKKNAYSVMTPRNFVQKTSTADIYAQKKSMHSTRAPKKVVGTTQASKTTTPSKDFLKSSPSSISQISFRDKKSSLPPKKAEAKATTIQSARKPSTPRSIKEVPFSNVTVNSPIAKRKLNMAVDSKIKKTPSKEAVKKLEKYPKEKEVGKRLERGDSKEIGAERQRTKTRTLDENEVKVLTPEIVDNNAEMINLSKRLSAKPKAFYVQLDDGVLNVREKKSSDDEEVSYEDDFESYESDFNSYHSDKTSAHSDNSSPQDDDEDNGEESEQSDANDEEYSLKDTATLTEDSPKEVKDEERMMDSGSFDLRDPRSASLRKPAMAGILEGSEGSEDQRPSLTDEGFQDMSSSSAVSSIKTLDRPLFIDFSKSKDAKRKRKLNERLRQRAQDLLSMITLHEMSYSLFEMKPIPYDLYMTTFGRSNYTQIAVQTYDDGINEEIQTEEIIVDQKWTQYPVEFSKHDVYLYPNVNNNKYGRNDEDYLTKFTFLVNNKTNVELNNKINLDKSYKENPLRMYFEQKDGVGSGEMLPYEIYKNKIKNNDFNVTRLRRFLKKVESRVSNILSVNTGDRNLSELVNSSNLPFSRGYSSISTKNINDEELSFLKTIKITNIIISTTKNNLIMSVHKKSTKELAGKCIICLWDVSVARREPLKVLIAIDDVTIGRFEGGSDGLFVAALEDSSIHLWDLSEEPTWRDGVVSEEKPTNLVEVKSDRLTQTEIDREWNLKNSNVGKENSVLQRTLQACAFTNSAANMTSSETIDCVVGLEFIGDPRTSLAQDGGRKIVGQVCLLQRIGILSIWSIIQEKAKQMDIGKAFWSRMKLEKTQTINVLDHIDLPTKEVTEDEGSVNFNLNAAKRRLSNKKSDKIAMKLRPKSNTSEFDSSRPTSAASFKKVLSIEKNVPQNWESGTVCYDLKVTSVGQTDSYLVAKNYGEVLCCTRIAGAVKIKRFCVATDTSPVTCLDVSPHQLPYFLAATDSGTVSLCSLVDARVLLTLDCRSEPMASDIEPIQPIRNDYYSSAPLEALAVILKHDDRAVVPILWKSGVVLKFFKCNGPPAEATYRCQSDHKGRFISSTKVTPTSTIGGDIHEGRLSISSVHWSHTNPCSIFTLMKDGTLTAWDLTFSDISAKSCSSKAASVCVISDNILALLTPEGDVHMHRLTTNQRSSTHLDLFKKYVTLL